jgi:transcriptional regulator with XRE-family HTH domain
MTQAVWQEQLTRVIAGEIRRYRHERGVSAQKLANECKRLGFPIPRNVLANLEHGRRETVSVAQLLVLAAALRIPPVLLVVPVARQESLEMLPGMETPTWHAALWWRGDLVLEDLGEGLVLVPGIAQRTAVDWVEAHQDLVERWSAADRIARDAAHDMHTGSPSEQDLSRKVFDFERENLDHFTSDLVKMRAEMRDRGLTPPALPQELPALAHDIGRIEQERGQHGSR